MECHVGNNGKWNGYVSLGPAKLRDRANCSQLIRTGPEFSFSLLHFFLFVCLFVCDETIIICSQLSLYIHAFLLSFSSYYLCCFQAI